MLEIENSSALKVAFVLFLVLLVLERVTNTFNDRNQPKRTRKVFHKGFFYALLGSYLTIISISVFSFVTSERISVLISWLGAAVLLMGIICRRSAIASLNGYWSIFIEIKENQQIVRNGIYRYFKHPYYTAVVLELIGFSLICNSYWGLILTATVQVPLLLIRVHYENRVLEVYGRRLGFNQ